MAAPERPGPLALLAAAAAADDDDEAGAAAIAAAAPYRLEETKGVPRNEGREKQLV